MSEGVNETQVVEYHAGLPVQLDPNPFRDIPGLYCSWDIDKPGGKDKLALMLRKAEKTIDECDGCVAEISDIGCHVVNLPSPADGELIPCMRTVFITADGHTIGTVSAVVWQALSLVARIYGPPPWNPPRPIRFTRGKSKKVGWFYTIEPVG